MASHAISRVAALACLALVVSACAGGASPVSPTGSQLDPAATTAGRTETPQQSETPATGDASAVERPAPDPGRPIAPDFSLELADGSSFRLSQETQPIFMVFWAEW